MELWTKAFRKPSRLEKTASCIKLLTGDIFLRKNVRLDAQNLNLFGTTSIDVLF